MSVLVLGGSAVVPSLLLLWYVYARDKNPEPRGMLLKTFLLGAFICVPVVPVAMLLQEMGQGMMGDMWGSAFAKGVLGAALPEEFFKFLVLRAYVWRKHHFDEPLDGVVYGATASLGFATLENILYVGQHGLEVAVLRAITAVPSHAFIGVVMGAFVGRARFAEPLARAGLLWTGLGAAILLHGAYDVFLFAGSGYALLAVVVLVIQVRWGRRLYKELQAEQVVMSPAMAGPVLAGSVVMAEGVGPSQVLLEGNPEPMAALRVGEPPVSSARRSQPERTVWSWIKLLMGGVSLSFCGLWWLGVAAVIFFPDSSGDALSTAGQVGLIFFSTLSTLLCGAIFRSGLRGPFAPVSG
ncbi:PrsW family glutamic-type intramembrane protease [Hyalangium versicolor]|uniref:PrsW family glutamic-type intramembrane protease n=1 Tax=Hyalangium versicolor TaxID=2861190 RepID=UPI00272B1B90|nr:PrsW family glutamic-type intramembrane protease [Hyalangium versicolor]